MRKIVASLLITTSFILPFVADAAIARDTSGKATSTGTTSTVALTLSASATVLIAAAWIRQTDTVTGVTWNGVSMTEIPTNSPQTFTQGATTFTMHLYEMFSPATGTHNLTVSASSNAGNALDILGVSYTGTSLTLDNSTKAGGTNSPISATLTPVGSGAWTILFADNEDSAVAASTGSTLIQNSHGGGIFDSNGIVSGATTMQATYTHSSSNWGAIMVSIAAPTATVVKTPDMIFYGAWDMGW